MEQRGGVLREARPAVARTGVQELRTDARVVAHADRDLRHVGVDHLAQVRDRVDERDLRREERVRRVLDHLGGRRIGDEHRRFDRCVQRADVHRALGVVAPDDDAIRVEEVVDRVTLAQELRVRRDGHAVGRCARFREHPLHEARRTDGNRRLVDHDGSGRSTGAISRATASTNDMSAAPSSPSGVGTQRKMNSASLAAVDAPTTNCRRRLAMPALTSSGQPVLEDRDLTLAQASDAVGVDVGTGHVVTEVREARCCRESDVAGTHHRDVHRVAPILRSSRRADEPSSSARASGVCGPAACPDAPNCRRRARFRRATSYMCSALARITAWQGGMNAARAQPLVRVFVAGRPDAPRVTKIDDFSLAPTERRQHALHSSALRANLFPARRATEIGRVMGGAMGPALRLDENEPSVGRINFFGGRGARRRPRHVSPGGSRRGLSDALVITATDAVVPPRDVSLRRARGIYATRIKPAMDLVVAPVIAVLALPLCLVIALVVRVTMGKGVLFRQKRVGKDGEPFEVVKFRTMRHDRRQRQQPIGIADRRRTHKHPNDPRHTRVGRFLRQSSLDELPQLLNVMRGEMSLIGPRPELIDLVDKYPDWLQRASRSPPRHDRPVADQRARREVHAGLRRHRPRLRRAGVHVARPAYRTRNTDRRAREAPRRMSTIRKISRERVSIVKNERANNTSDAPRDARACADRGASRRSS